jgi:hypothetical protein
MQPKTSEELMAQALGIVNHPLATAEERKNALQVAYDLGHADGKVDGAKRAWDEATAALRKVAI